MFFSLGYRINLAAIAFFPLEWKDRCTLVERSVHWSEKIGALEWNEYYAGEIIREYREDKPGRAVTLHADY